MQPICSHCTQVPELMKRQQVEEISRKGSTQELCGMIHNAISVLSLEDTSIILKSGISLDDYYQDNLEKKKKNCWWCVRVFGRMGKVEVVEERWRRKNIRSGIWMHHSSGNMAQCSSCVHCSSAPVARVLFDMKCQWVLATFQAHLLMGWTVLELNLQRVWHERAFLQSEMRISVQPFHLKRR